MTPLSNSNGESKKMVLLVDDDAYFRFAMATELRAAGHLVQSAENGERAIRMFEDKCSGDFCIDLVITDLVMPRKDGMRFCNELRQIDPDMPVLVISGNLSPEIQRELSALGCQDSLEKPFTPADLLRKVEKLLLIKEVVEKEWENNQTAREYEQNQNNVENRTNGKGTSKS